MRKSGYTESRIFAVLKQGEAGGAFDLEDYPPLSFVTALE